MCCWRSTLFAASDQRPILSCSSAPMQLRGSGQLLVDEGGHVGIAVAHQISTF